MIKLEDRKLQKPKTSKPNLVEQAQQQSDPNRLAYNAKA